MPGFHEEDVETNSEDDTSEEQPLVQLGPKKLIHDESETKRDAQSAQEQVDVKGPTSQGRVQNHKRCVFPTDLWLTRGDLILAKNCTKDYGKECK